MPAKLTQAEFLAKAVAVHGVGRYDYSQALYKTTFVRVVIICPTHGSFEQTPDKHLRGRGCIKCAIGENAAKKTYSTSEFIALAQKKHGNTYDYSLAEYETSRGKVCIVCSTHGSFMQEATLHLSGSGCPSCGITKLTLSQRHSKEKFIAKAIRAHADRYDYSQLHYKGSGVKVKIICRQHGEFEQAPPNHINGHGCPQCGAGEREVSRQEKWLQRAAGKVAVLYLLRVYSDKEEFFKIGITCDLRKRFRGTGIDLIGYQYEILAEFKSNDAMRVFDWEQSILATFNHLRYRPQKAFHGSTECFTSASEILSIFPL